MKNSPFDLTGKTAIVTGGGSGLGYAISEEFIRAGAKVVITGTTEPKLKNACENLGDKCNYVVNDVTALETLPWLAGYVEETFGQIDILVNNAGVHLKKPVLEVTDEEFKRVIETNLVGVFALTREVSKYMMKRKTGSIILISSMAAMYGLPLVAAYSASKSAIQGMTHSLASELSPNGLRVNTIAPGFIETDMSRKALEADPDRKERVLRRTPLGKLGLPQDIGFSAVFLASEAARYITGATLPVDGGNSVGF